MNRSTATADAFTVAAARARATNETRHDRRAPAPQALRARDLPREHRISNVFRTIGRGLVVEYDPA